MSAGPAPFAEGEEVSFDLVGARDYVRGLDVLDLIERRLGGEVGIELRFLRPLSCVARLSLSRTQRPSVTCQWRRTDGIAGDLHFLSTESANAARIADPPLRRHFTLIRGRDRQAWLILGARTTAEILAVVFAEFQAHAGRRFVLKRLAVQARRTWPLEIIAVHSTDLPRGRQRFDITRNAARWCEIETGGD